MTRALVLVDGEHYPATTRWALHGARAEGYEVVACLFVGGTGRSGTHVIAKLLAKHSKLALVPVEVRFHVEALEHTESTEQAHMDAGKVVVDRSSVLLAVWDGQPSRGLGGTADVVAYARQRGVPVTVIWPEGASRDA